MTKEDGEKSVGVSLVFYEEVKDINICHAIHTLQVLIKAPFVLSFASQETSR